MFKLTEKISNVGFKPLLDTTVQGICELVTFLNNK